jgi:hypothetical protein
VREDQRSVATATYIQLDGVGAGPDGGVDPRDRVLGGKGGGTATADGSPGGLSWGALSRGGRLEQDHEV